MFASRTQRRYHRSVKITGFTWLEDVVEKLRFKHRVEPQEVVELLTSGPLFRFVERGHRPGEDVYAGLGQLDNGRYLIVFFVHKRDGRALILSGRDMTMPERRRYERT